MTNHSKASDHGKGLCTIPTKFFVSVNSKVTFKLPNERLDYKKDLDHVIEQ
jgi:hypothetical protein